MALIYIPTLLRHLSEGKDRVVVPGRNVRQVIDALDAMYSGFKEQLVDDDAVHAEVAVVVDEEVVTRGLLEPVKEDSEVRFLPSVSGG